MIIIVVLKSDNIALSASVVNMGLTQRGLDLLLHHGAGSHRKAGAFENNEESDKTPANVGTKLNWKLLLWVEKEEMYMVVTTSVQQKHCLIIATSISSAELSH